MAYRCNFEIVVSIVHYCVPDLGMNDDDDEAVPLPNVSGAIMKKVSR